MESKGNGANDPILRFKRSSSHAFCSTFRLHPSSGTGQGKPGCTFTRPFLDRLFELVLVQTASGWAVCAAARHIPHTARTATPWRRAPNSPGAGASAKPISRASEYCIVRTELRQNSLPSGAQGFLRNEYETQAAALRAHGMGDVNRNTWKKELDSCREHINPSPLIPCCCRCRVCCVCVRV